MRISLFSLLLVCISIATADITREPAEIMLEQAVQSLLAGQEHAALTTLEQTIQDHPNFRLARMFYADLLASRAELPPLLSAPLALSKARIADLSDEAQARLNYQPPIADLLPSNIARLSRTHHYIILFDAQQSRLYVFKNDNGQPQLVADYYASSGRGGMNKQSEGDNRTPSGVYKITQVLDDEQLPELYGRNAYTLNYPNSWDQLQNRDGYGIWLHGVPRITYSRPPETSRGCVVSSNQAIQALNDYIKAGTTPAILANQVDWLDKQQWSAHQQNLLSVVRRWRDDWQSLDVEKYLSHYSKHYVDKKYDYLQMAKRTRKNAEKKTFVEVVLKDFDLMLYSKEPELFLAQFHQDYHSNNYKISYRKQQLWRLEDGVWKIVFEGRA